MNPECHIGEIHGVYTIIDVLDEKDKYGHWIYKCICNECGYVKFSHYGGITGEKRKVMNCQHKRNYWSNKRLSKIFHKMMARCYNSNSKDYKWYGKKGIKICDEWYENPNNFEKWAINNGYQDNLTIDRIDPDKDYCPENCRWIPLKENSRRAGMVTWIELDEKIMTGRQWADYLNIGTNTINKIIHQYGVDKTKELILAMLKEPPSTKHRKSHQTWFSVYNIKV